MLPPFCAAYFDGWYFSYYNLKFSRHDCTVYLCLWLLNGWLLVIILLLMHILQCIPVVIIIVVWFPVGPRGSWTRILETHASLECRNWCQNHGSNCLNVRYLYQCGHVAWGCSTLKHSFQKWILLNRIPFPSAFLLYFFVIMWHIIALMLALYFEL